MDNAVNVPGYPAAPENVQLLARPSVAPGAGPLPARMEQQRPWPASRSHSLVLKANNAAPGLAREALRECLATWGLDRFHDHASAITGELVANAVAASTDMAATVGKPPVAVAFWVGVERGALFVRVWDADPTPPPQECPPPDLLAEHGRGLMIVAALCHRWDWYPAGGGKFVRATIIMDAPLPAF
jgi:hypothetical protein